MPIIKTEWSLIGVIRPGLSEDSPPERGSDGRPAIRVAAVAPEEGLWDEIRGIMHGSVCLCLCLCMYVCHCLHTRFNFKRHQVCCKPSSLSFAAESSCAMLSVTVSCYIWSGHDASLCIIVYITSDFFWHWLSLPFLRADCWYEAYFVFPNTIDNWMPCITCAQLYSIEYLSRLLGVLEYQYGHHLFSKTDF